MLKLAEQLNQANIQVSFINTEYNHDRLLLSANLPSFYQHHPNFHFLFFSDGLPPDHPRVGKGFLEFLFSVKAVTEPALCELLVSLSKKTGQPQTCIIADVAMSSSALEVAKEFEISYV
ncbi:hypothetical protein REPUB_Repub02eG0270900 [Reevesia pubescens]